MSDQENEKKPYKGAKRGPKPKVSDEILTGPQPPGKEKRGRGRPPKREGYVKNDRDRRAYAPPLPEICKQTDQDLIDEGKMPDKSFSDWAKIKYKIFADAVFEGNSFTDAYKLAGYKCSTEQTAHAAGSKLAQHPWVQAYLRRKHMEMVQEPGVGAEIPAEDEPYAVASDDEIIQFFTMQMRDTTLSVSKRMEAAKELAKLKSMYTEKLQILTPVETEKSIMDALGLSEDDED